MINRCHSNALFDFHSTYPNRPKIIHQHSPHYIAINEVCRIQIRIQIILIGILLVPSLADLSLSLTRTEVEEEEQRTQDFPTGDERRHGRTNALVLFCIHLAQTRTSSTRDGYIGGARSARTPRSTPTH
jgi:hypothetical protein